MTDELLQARSAASTADAGRATDDSQGRAFPCEQCGANMTFHIGQQSLRCPFCDHVEEMQIDAEATIVEQDLTVMVNAPTGEVQGERPWSWAKITLATVAGLVVAEGIGAAVYFTN